MSSMRFTKSRDGLLRTDVRVTHRLGLHELAACLCLFMLHNPNVDLDDMDYSLLDKVSKTRLRNIVAGELGAFGLSRVYYWDDDLPDEQSDAAVALYAKATYTVLSRYPELRQ